MHKKICLQNKSSETARQISLLQTHNLSIDNRYTLAEWTTVTALLCRREWALSISDRTLLKSLYRSFLARLRGLPAGLQIMILCFMAAQDVRQLQAIRGSCQYLKTTIQIYQYQIVSEAINSRNSPYFTVRLLSSSVTLLHSSSSSCIQHFHGYILTLTKIDTTGLLGMSNLTLLHSPISLSATGMDFLKVSSLYPCRNLFRAQARPLRPLF